MTEIDEVLDILETTGVEGLTAVDKVSIIETGDSWWIEVYSLCKGHFGMCSSLPAKIDHPLVRSIIVSNLVYGVPSITPKEISTLGDGFDEEVVLTLHRFEPAKLALVGYSFSGTNKWILYYEKSKLIVYFES